MGNPLAKQKASERLQNMSYQREKKYSAKEMLILDGEEYIRTMTQRARRLTRPKKPGSFKQKRRNQMSGRRY